MIRSFLTGIDPARQLRKDPSLVVLGLFMLASFSGYLAFVRGAAPVLPPWLAPGTLEIVRSAFTQLQIVLFAMVLALQVSGRNAYPTIAVAAVAIASWAIEALGVRTGFPFGAYAYSDQLGMHLPGGVPWTIPVSWATATLSAHLLVSKLLPQAGRGAARVVATSLLLLSWDLALDPAMSTVNGLWTWATPGTWYGVPLLNLAGWYLSGLLFAAILETGRIPSVSGTLSVRWLATFWFLQGAMPVAMVAAEGMWGAAFASVTLSVMILIALGIRRGIPDDSSGPGHHELNLEFLGKNSKSFRFASVFLSPEMQRIVAAVYGWCRLTDDLVDEAGDLPKSEVRARLDAWEAAARGAYHGHPSGSPLVDHVFGEMARREVPFEYARDLVDGMRMDLEPRLYCNDEDLRTYSWRVASVIGVWLTRTAGTHDAWVLERAAALGHAMQLTNILRDVGDDHRMGRIYLPLQDLMDAGLTESDLRDYVEGRRAPDKVWRELMERLMERADSDYRSAYEGMPHLPWSFRIAVAVAASVYRGIHDEIRRNGYDNFRRRAVVGSWRKVRLAFLGVLLLAKAHLPGQATIPVVAHPR